MAGRLASLLDPSRIMLQVRNTKRTAALKEVASLLENHPEVTNFGGFYKELLARDRLDTTCLGNGIALPHARTEHVQGIVIAIGRSPEGIVFEKTEETVQLMFVLGTPKSNPTDYLQLVSILCKIFKDPSVRENLLKADTPESFASLLCNAEASLSSVKVGG